MLIVLTMSIAMVSAASSGRGAHARAAAIIPRPVPRPMRAATSWMATMNGKDSTTLHNWPVPNCAPACE